jgi:hypothetical protein
MRVLVIALALVADASPGLPRPRGTSVLSFEQRGYTIQAYEVQGTPSEALATYARTLTDFRVYTIQGALAVRGRETAIVHAFREGERTVLALVKLGDEAHDH